MTGGGAIATLTVRGLDDGLVRKLRIRAAEHGHSAEAEHREILKQALDGAPQPSRDKIIERLTSFREEMAAAWPEWWRSCSWRPGATACAN